MEAHESSDVVLLGTRVRDAVVGGASAQVIKLAGGIVRDISCGAEVFDAMRVTGGDAAVWSRLGRLWEERDSLPGIG